MADRDVKLMTENDSKLERLLLGHWLVEQTQPLTADAGNDLHIDAREDITPERVDAVREGIRVALEHIGKFIGNVNIDEGGR